ncbi:MAG: PilZ domain-containing protein [Candidatus Omnitrophica bacterium]|nr:PilZ domain-containing protein [Candidatus Omnitrophota bacterium]
MNQERRKAVRILTRDSVANCRLLTIETKGQFQFTVWPIRNISAEGIAIYSDEKVPNGSLAFLNIDLDVILRTVGVIAKVIWCKKNKVGYDLGLNFSWWPKPFDKSLVLDFVKQKLDHTDYNE